MSKTISDALKAHLAQTVTTLTTCWKMVRVDGTTYGFTTLDQDLTIDGLTYRSMTGFSRTAIVTGSTGQIDNLEVIGFFDDSGVVQQDLKNGLFNYASIFLFMVNYRDLSQGILKLRRGWLGETVTMQNGQFHAELRGMTQALVQEFANVVSPLCRADLGDTKCQIPILPSPWVPDIGYALGSFVRPATQTTDALKIAIFQCTAAGTSAATEPTWDTTVGDATTETSGVVWTSVAPFRRIGTVASAVSSHQFVVSPPLVYPAGMVGNTATINVQNNVSAGTALELNDGINSQIVLFTGDTIINDAKNDILTQIAASALDWTVSTTALGPTWLINIVNNSGVQGNITKTGDINNPPGLLITDFAPGYLDAGVITWITGQNAGVTMEIKLYDINTTSVILWLGMNFPITAGDTFFYHPGCDKRRETCFNKFNNIVNFRGEPDVPGLDRMLAYPDAS